MVTYLFKPPTVWEGYGMGARLTGRSVWCTDGVWHEHQCPAQDQLASAAYAYQGGHEYVIDQAARDALVAAGYSPEVYG